MCFLPCKIISFCQERKIVCRKYLYFIRGDSYKLGQRPLQPKRFGTLIQTKPYIHRIGVVVCVSLHLWTIPRQIMFWKNWPKVENAKAPPGLGIVPTFSVNPKWEAPQRIWWFLMMASTNHEWIILVSLLSPLLYFVVSLQWSILKSKTWRYTLSLVNTYPLSPKRCSIHPRWKCFSYLFPSLWVTLIHHFPLYQIQTYSKSNLKSNFCNEAFTSKSECLSSRFRSYIVIFFFFPFFSDKIVEKILLFMR